MADQAITDYSALASPALTDLIEIVNGGANYKITPQTLRQLLTPASTCEGRLTLTTATPVTTADVTGATSVYFTPYKGKKIGLYSGSVWNVYDFTEITLNIAAFTASKPYDIFCYDNSGTPTLEGLVWTNATTRATALALQDGIYVKSGAATRRYLGTIYVNSSGGQTDDSATLRCVWNFYNRIPKNLYRTEATSHTYATNTVRAWNGSATIPMNFVIGVAEQPVLLELTAQTRSDSAGTPSQVGIGYDVVNASLSGMLEIRNATTSNIRCGSSFEHYPTIGYHYYHAVENSPGTATCTFDLVFTGAKIWC